MSQPGIGLNAFHLVFIEKVTGDHDEHNQEYTHSDKTVIEKKVHFSEEIVVCFFLQKDKVIQILDGKKKMTKEILK